MKPKKVHGFAAPRKKRIPAHHPRLKWTSHRHAFFGRCKMADRTSTPKEGAENHRPHREGGLLARALKGLLGQSLDVAALGVLVIAIVFLVFLIYGVIGRWQVLDRLSTIEYARGLITYILAVGTMAIAMVVAIGGLLSKGENAEEKAEAEKRFSRGKEILTILIGVLGTIVGFYYGSQAGENGREGLAMSTPLISTVADDKIRLTSFFHGGVPPYQYEISFKGAPESAAWKQRKGKADATGWAVEEFELVGAKPGRLTYTINVTDAKGASNSYVSDEAASFEVKAKPPEKLKVEPPR